MRFQSLHPSVASSWKVAESAYGYRPSDHRMETARTTLDVTGTPVVAQDLAYLHDASGNLLQIDDLLNRLDQNFSYDALHRLESADGFGSHGYGYLSFAYDGAGNLLEKGPALPGTGAPAAGRLRLSYERLGGGPAGVGAVEIYGGMGFGPSALYTQDADGSVDSYTKSGVLSTLDRDDDGRIREVTRGTQGVTHHYELSGERVEKLHLAMGFEAGHRYYVDAGYEVDALAGSHQAHLFLGGRRVATSKRPGLGAGSPVTTTADAVEFYHPDHVGSNTLVTDAAGQGVQESFLTPFGELHALVDGSGSPVSPNASTTPHLFTDQEHDPETGLHYFGARFHDPWIGRFLSQDPELIGPTAGISFDRIEGDPQHLNPYAYVLNRPTTLTDPTGTYPLEGIAGGASSIFLGLGRPLTEDGRVVWEESEPDRGDRSDNGHWEVFGAAVGVVILTGTESGAPLGPWGIVIVTGTWIAGDLLFGGPISQSLEGLLRGPQVLQQSGESGDDAADSRPDKVPKPGVGEKEGAKDVPSWAKGERPKAGESGKDFADRLLGRKYGPGNYPKGPGSEHSKIQKWGDRAFQDP